MTFDPSELAAMGLSQPARAVRELSHLSGIAGHEFARQVLVESTRSSDADRFIAAFGRLTDPLPESAAQSALPLLVPLFRASDLFPRVIPQRPGLVRWLAGSRTLNDEKPRERYTREALAAVRHAAPDALKRRLRRYKYRELLRIGVRDLALGVRSDIIGRETSALAEGLVRAALFASEGALTARYGVPDNDSRFAVLGLGKLGGEDLNFSSDIDLIYLYTADGKTSGGTDAPIPNAQFFTKLAERLTQTLTETTADGFCYRVDLNLRPQGRSGAIVLSLGATVSYYETLGRTWERAALLKARCVAGDGGLAQALLAELDPFIWRRSLDLSAVDELRALKAQIDLRGKATQDDIKLGPGGIREIEFFVNALQLLHGGKAPQLRERNTLRALRKLRLVGVVSTRDADALEEAYLFLRRVENHLQMVDERQTQEVPSGTVERLRLAQSVGLARWEELEAELQRHRSYVQNAFATLLGQTAREDTPDEPLLALALDPDAPEEARESALASRGFVTPKRTLQAINRLARIRESPFELGPSASGMQGVKLLAEIARTPDPDQAVLHFADFIGHSRAPSGYLSLLSRSPQLGRRLVNLFGQSNYLSRYFLRHPELVETLVEADFDVASKGPTSIRRAVAQRLEGVTDPEERLGVLRRVRNEEVLRIGMHDILGELDVPQVAEQLTAIAEACLGEALALAEAEQRERYGDPVGAGGVETLAIIAMGKLGGKELGYHSDLDLIFVYSGRGTEQTKGGSRGQLTHHELFAKIAQRLMTFLEMQLREGHLYHVDTRLRPSGNKGPLVVSQESFREHHEKRAQLWERQALIKARGVAGDPTFFAELCREVIEPAVYLRPLPPSAGQEIDRIRKRMENELAQESREQLNLKVGHGGLVDVEFATQYLQLLHGKDVPDARTTSTLEALSALAAEGLISQADAQTLRQGYIFLRRVENRLRLVHGRSMSLLPTDGEPLRQLARRLGYVGPDSGPELLADLRSSTERVRAAYARIVGGSLAP